jgi:hypothetical protein
MKGYDMDQKSGLGKFRHFLDFAMPVEFSGIFRYFLAKSGILWTNVAKSFHQFKLTFLVLTNVHTLGLIL